MTGPLLATKLHVPQRRSGSVARPRLTEQLDRGAEAALTLVSAPAGFGKTALLTEWLAAGPPPGRAVAWLSLEERDDDPPVFWRYLVAALQTARPGVGAGALALLQSPHSSLDAVLTALVNDLTEVGPPVVLVLDDYHLIEAAEVHGGMAFLVEHLPAQVQLVVAGRADPALPLARLRAGGQLVELRAAELRFTAEEAAAYLTGAMGLALTDGDVAALAGRTEGWIAALQLAALSMRGRDDPAGFIADFAGRDVPALAEPDARVQRVVPGLRAVPVGPRAAHPADPRADRRTAAARVGPGALLRSHRAGHRDHRSRRRPDRGGGVLAGRLPDRQGLQAGRGRRAPARRRPRPPCADPVRGARRPRPSTRAGGGTWSRARGPSRR